MTREEIDTQLTNIVDTSPDQAECVFAHALQILLAFKDDVDARRTAFARHVRRIMAVEAVLNEMAEYLGWPMNSEAARAYSKRLLAAAGFEESVELKG